jgi:hypothetical protein
VRATLQFLALDFALALACALDFALQCWAFVYHFLIFLKSLHVHSKRNVLFDASFARALQTQCGSMCSLTQALHVHSKRNVVHVLFDASFTRALQTYFRLHKLRIKIHRDLHTAHTPP